MKHSYNYTKRFIDDQVNILNEPFKITPRMISIIGGNLTEDQLKLILNKINNDLQLHNERLFPAQINNQIILQIMKLETQKLKIVNQQLYKLNAFVKPIILPDFENLSNYDQHEKLIDMINMIDELPELKYLFVSEDGITNVEDDYSIDEDETNNVELDDNTIQDTEEQVESRKQINKEFIEEIIDEVNELNGSPEPELIEKYDKLRMDLIEISKALKYKTDKIEYLNNLQHNINQLFNRNQPQMRSDSNELYDSDEELHEAPKVNNLQNNLQFKNSATETRNLASEINRFRILVEQISYKVNTKGITASELRDKLQELNR